MHTPIASCCLRDSRANEILELTVGNSNEPGMTDAYRKRLTRNTCVAEPRAAHGRRPVKCKGSGGGGRERNRGKLCNWGGRQDFLTIPLDHIVEVKGTNQCRKQTLR